MGTKWQDPLARSVADLKPMANQTDPRTPHSVAAIGNILKNSTQNNGTINFESHDEHKHYHYSLLNQSSRASAREPDSPEERCRRELCLTVPSEDQGNITSTKGSIVRGTCKWIEDVQEFKDWLGGMSQLLWISGGPGKGKTYLSIHLVKNLARIRSSLSSEEAPKSLVLEYYCDNSDIKRNTALCILRGLLYQLLERFDELYEIILPPFKDHSRGNKTLFAEEHKEKLWLIFLKMLSMIQKDTYLVLDGLDECDDASIDFVRTKLQELHDGERTEELRISTAVVSRPRLDDGIQNCLRINLDNQILEERQNDIGLFISDRVARLELGQTQRVQLERVLMDRANGTYLWVALAISFLKPKGLEMIQEILDHKYSIDLLLPEGLNAMYDRILISIPAEDRVIALKIVQCLSIAFRPLSEAEVAAITGLQEERVETQMKRLANLLSNATNGRFQLVHLSLRQYLQRVPSIGLLASSPNLRHPLLGVMDFVLERKFLVHMLESVLFALALTGLVALLVPSLLSYCVAIFSVCVGTSLIPFAMGNPPITSPILLSFQRSLRIYDFGIRKTKAHGELLAAVLKLMGKHFGDPNRRLLKPGTLATEIEDKDLEEYLPSVVQYGCSYWTRHLQEQDMQLLDPEEIHSFLQKYLLHWLEAMGIMKSMNECIPAMSSISLISVKGSRKLVALIKDAKRFFLQSRRAIEQAPRQVFISGLIFAPRRSIIRQTFERDTPGWVRRKPVVKEDWGRMLQTFEGHTASVSSVAFSAPRATHGKQKLASASEDHTVKLWDIDTGSLLQTLKGHGSAVSAIAFSTPKATDSEQLLAVAHWGRKILLWDVESDPPRIVDTLESGEGGLTSIAFSAPLISGQKEILASMSISGMISLWEIRPNSSPRRFYTYKSSIKWAGSVAFSFPTAADRKQLLAFPSTDSTISLMDVDLDPPRQIHDIDNISGSVKALAFSSLRQPDQKMTLASSSDRNHIRLWKVSSGPDPPQLIHTIQSDYICGYPVAFLVSAEAQSKQILAFSLRNYAIELIEINSDSNTIRPLQKLEGHRYTVGSLAFSSPVALDGKRLLASASQDGTIRLWDVSTSSVLPTEECILKGHTAKIRSVDLVSSGSDGRWLLASASDDCAVRLWEIKSDLDQPRLLHTLYGHTKQVNHVTFSSTTVSSGRQLLASASEDCTVLVWDVSSKLDPPKLLDKFYCDDHAKAVAFLAPPMPEEGEQIVAFASTDGLIQLSEIGSVPGPTREIQVIDTTLLISYAELSVAPTKPNGEQQLVGVFDGEVVQRWNISSNPAELLQQGDSPWKIEQISFSEDGKWLQTDQGLLDLDLSPVVADECSYQDMRICIRNEWIMWKDKRLIWLPPEYRGMCQAWKGGRLCVGYISGKVDMWELDLNCLLNLFMDS